MKNINIQYFAILKEKCGITDESVQTDAQTAADLFEEIKQKYQFELQQDVFRVAINDEFSQWNAALNDGDQVVFIPPVSGG